MLGRASSVAERRRVQVFRVGLLTLSALGCNGDSFSAAELDLGGTWIFNATVEETTQTCNVTETPITFTAVTADSLVGKGGEGGTIQCTSGTRTFAANPYLEHSTVFLTRTGSTVRIDRHGSLLFRGEIRSASRMSGTTTMDSLPGTWIGQRQ
jgi:hypothetical protein